MKLSILIAAYNVEQFIKKCLLSCYQEEYGNDYEIIVVNDGSTDNTSDVLEQLEIEIPNLKIVYQENTGLGAARNTGIQYAKGVYVWMIDGDDFLEPNSIPCVLEKLKSDEDIYAFNYRIVNEKNTQLSVKDEQNNSDNILDAITYYQKHQELSYTWQYVCKKSLFIDNQLHFKQNINMQDSEILPKIMFFAQRVLISTEIVYNYVQQKTSFTNTNNGQKRIKYFQSIIEVDKSLNDFAEKIKDKSTVLYEAIQLKRISLHRIVFNHLVFFKYNSQTLKSILTILKQADFYPLKYKPTEFKKKMIKIALNFNPIISKFIIDKLRK
jgi:glycosyltransferase involved in cell wall biosynthesis